MVLIYIQINIFSFITIIIKLNQRKLNTNIGDFIANRVKSQYSLNNNCIFFRFFLINLNWSNPFFCIKALLLKLNNEFSRQLSRMQAYTLTISVHRPFTLWKKNISKDFSLSKFSSLKICAIVDVEFLHFHGEFLWNVCIQIVYDIYLHRKLE